MIPCEWITQAVERVQPYIDKTPLSYDDQLNLYIKWENQQRTGSFKVRGAYNKVLTLQDWEIGVGLVAASAGNHGLGVAIAAQQVGTRAVIFASENAVPAKLKGIKDYGAEIRLVPGSYSDAEQAGIRYAETSGMTWISPYNDWQVIAGQATLGVEILEQLPGVESLTWLVPVGGGGLLAGIACAVDCSASSPNTTSQRNLNSRLVGVQSEASPFFHAIYHHGTQDGIMEHPSLADGLSGRIDPQSITIPILKRYLDDFMLVSEIEIQETIRYAWERYQQVIEGSAAAALALALKDPQPHEPFMVIITGGNIQRETHRTIVNDFEVK